RVEERRGGGGRLDPRAGEEGSSREEAEREAIAAVVDRLWPGVRRGGREENLLIARALGRGLDRHDRSEINVLRLDEQVGLTRGLGEARQRRLQIRLLDLLALDFDNLAPVLFVRFDLDHQFLDALR